MAIPNTKALLDWADNYVKLWNAGDKDGWAENWRRVAPGDFRMLDPVGTPEKFGFEHCCLDSFDLFQPKVKFRIQPGSLFVCDNEVAWLLENHVASEVEGVEATIQYSIENYRFDDDGSVQIRTFYRVPTHSDKDLGDIFKVYLPEGDG
ncbi:MAG TPA: hypothetical protein ENI05_05110 [Porticoccus sp.]|nr:hypothetical protein [Porticoccus sp.]